MFTVVNVHLPQPVSETDERILAACEQVFARRGLEGTRVRELAEAVGVTPAALYKHFPSKEALYEAVLDRGIQPLIELLVAFSTRWSEAEPMPREAMVEQVMLHLAQRPALCRLLYLEAIGDGVYLDRVAERWLAPLFEQVLRPLQTNPGGQWDPELFREVAASFVHLSFGHFALAPLLHRATGVDPASPEGVKRQTRFITLLIERMFPASEVS